MYWKEKRKSRYLDSKSDVSGAGDTAFSDSEASARNRYDGSKDYLNDKLSRLEFERLTGSGKRDRRGRWKRRSRSHKVRRSSGGTQMAPGDERSSSDSETEASRMPRKSSSFPDLVSPSHRYSEDFDSRELSSYGPRSAQSAVPLVRPSVSDTLLHSGSGGHRPQPSRRDRHRPRFPDRLHRRRRGRNSTSEGRSSFTNDSISMSRHGRIQYEPVRPSEGHLQIHAEGDKEDPKPSEVCVLNLVTEGGPSIPKQKYQSHGQGRHRQQEKEAVSLSSQVSDPGRRTEGSMDTVSPFTADRALSETQDAEKVGRKTKPVKETSDPDITTRKGNRRSRWTRGMRVDLSPTTVSSSSHPLSRHSPTTISPSSSIWLASLLSETDTRLGDIDREMDSVLKQVSSAASHSAPTEWSSESLGFVGGRTSSSSTEFTDLKNDFRRLKPPNSDTTAISSDDLSLTETDDSKRKKHVRKSSRIYKISDDRSLAEQSGESDTPGASSSVASHSTAVVKSETSEFLDIPEPRESRASDRTLSSGQELESRLVPNLTDQTRSMEETSDRKHGKKREDDTDQDPTDPIPDDDSSVGASDSERATKQSSSGSDHQPDNSKISERDSDSATLHQSGSSEGERTGGEEDEPALSDDQDTDKTSQAERDHKQSTSHALTSAPNDSSHHKSSALSSKFSKSNAEGSHKERKRQKTISISERNDSTHSGSRRNRSLSSTREQDNKVKVKELNAETGPKGRERNDPVSDRSISHRSKVSSASATAQKDSSQASQLIEGLDGEEQPSLPESSASRRPAGSSDRGRTSPDIMSTKSSLKSPAHLSSEERSADQSQSEAQTQQGLSQEATQLDSTHRGKVTPSDLFDTPATDNESTKPASYDDKKSQVLRMFDPKYFSFPLYVPPPSLNSSLPYSMPPQWLYPSPVQSGQAASTGSEFSTMDTQNVSSDRKSSSSLPRSSKITDSQNSTDLRTTLAGPQETRMWELALQDSEPQSGIHRGLRSSAQAWQFMTPGLGSSYRDCAYKSMLAADVATLPGHESLSYKASNLLFQDTVSQPDFSSADKTSVGGKSESEGLNPASSRFNKEENVTLPKVVSLTKTSKFPDSSSAQDQRSAHHLHEVKSMSIQKTVRNLGRKVPDRSKSFPAQARLKTNLPEGQRIDQTNKPLEPGSVEPSILDQLWQSERSKELNKLKTGGSQTAGSLETEGVGKQVAQSAGSTATVDPHTSRTDYSGAGSKELGSSTVTTRESSSMEKSQPQPFASKTSSLTPGSPNMSFRDSTFPPHCGPSRVTSNLKTFPWDANAKIPKTPTDIKLNKPKQTTASGKQFLDTINKELDNFVGTAAWSSSRAPGQIRIDWDKCSDERKRRQQEKLKKVLVTETPHTSQILQQFAPDGTHLAGARGVAHHRSGSLEGLGERAFLRPDQNAFSEPINLNYTDPRHLSQASANQEIGVDGPAQSKGKCSCEDSAKDQLTSSSYSKTHHGSLREGGKIKPHFVFASHTTHSSLSGSHRQRIAHPVSVQASSSRRFTKHSAPASSNGSSPSPSESQYSTGQDDVASLESWASAATKTSQRHPCKLPPSVVVLSPAEVNHLIEEEELHSQQSSDASGLAGDGTDTSLPRHAKVSASTVSKLPGSHPAYRTSGKPFTGFQMTSHHYTAAQDTIMCARQLTKFRTSRRPGTQFGTPGIPMIPSDPKLARSAASSPSSSEFMSLPSEGEASQQESWTSVKMSEETESVGVSHASNDIRIESTGEDHVSYDDPSKVHSFIDIDRQSSPGSEYRSEEGMGDNSDSFKTNFSGVSTHFASDEGSEKLSSADRDHVTSPEVRYLSQHERDSKAEQQADLSTVYGSEKGTNLKSEWGAGTEYGSDKVTIYKSDWGTDYGSENGTNYKSDWGTAYVSDSEPDISPETELGHVSETRSDLEQHSRLKTAVEDTSLSSPSVAVLLPESQERSLTGKDPVPSKSNGVSTLHSQDTSGKGAIDTTPRYSKATPLQGSKLVGKACTAESQQGYKSEPDREDALRVLSYLSSDQHSNSATSLDPPSVFKLESESVESPPALTSAKSPSQSYASRKSEAGIVHEVQESELDNREHSFRTQSHKADLSGADVKSSSLPAEANASVQKPGMSPRPENLALPSVVKFQIPERASAVNLLQFSRTPSPVEGTSLTSEWNTYPSGQRVGKMMTRENQTRTLSAVDEISPPGAAGHGVSEGYARNATQQEVVPGQSGVSLGKVSSPSLPTWSDHLAYTVSVFPRSLSRSPHTEGGIPGSTVATGTVQIGPISEQALRTEPDPVQRQMKQDSTSPGPNHHSEPPTTLGNAGQRNLALNPLQPRPESSLPTPDRAGGSVPSRSFTDFNDRLEQIISGPPGVESAVDNSLIPELSPQTPGLLRGPTSQRVDQSAQHAAEHSSSVHKMDSSALRDLNNQTKVAHQVAHPSHSTAQVYGPANHVSGEQVIPQGFLHTGPAFIQTNELSPQVNNSVPVSTGSTVQQVHNKDSRNLPANTVEIPGKLYPIVSPELKTHATVNNAEARDEGYNELMARNPNPAGSKLGEMPLDTGKTKNTTANAVASSNSVSKSNHPDPDGSVQLQDRTEKELDGTANLINFESLTDIQGEGLVSQPTGASDFATQPQPQSISGLFTAGTVNREDGKARTRNSHKQSRKVKTDRKTDLSSSGNNQPATAPTSLPTPNMKSLDFNITGDTGAIKSVRSSIWKSPKGQTKTVRFEHQGENQVTATATGSQAESIGKQAREILGSNMLNNSTFPGNSSPFRPNSVDSTGLVGNSFASPASSVDQRFLEAASPVCSHGSDGVSPTTTEQVANLDSSFDFSLNSIVTLHTVEAEVSMGKHELSRSDQINADKMVQNRKVSDETNRSSEYFGGSDSEDSRSSGFKFPVRISYGQSAFASVRSSQSTYSSNLTSSQGELEHSSGSKEKVKVEDYGSASSLSKNSFAGVRTSGRSDTDQIDILSCRGKREKHQKQKVQKSCSSDSGGVRGTQHTSDCTESHVIPSSLSPLCGSGENSSPGFGTSTSSNYAPRLYSPEISDPMSCDRSKSHPETAGKTSSTSNIQSKPTMILYSGASSSASVPDDYEPGEDPCNSACSSLAISVVSDQVSFPTTDSSSPELDPSPQDLQHPGSSSGDKGSRRGQSAAITGWKNCSSAFESPSVPSPGNPMALKHHHDLDMTPSKCQDSYLFGGSQLHESVASQQGGTSRPVHSSLDALQCTCQKTGEEFDGDRAENTSKNYQRSIANPGPSTMESPDPSEVFTHRYSNPIRFQQSAFRPNDGIRLSASSSSAKNQNSDMASRPIIYKSYLPRVATFQPGSTVRSNVVRTEALPGIELSGQFGSDSSNQSHVGETSFRNHRRSKSFSRRDT